MRGIYLVNEQMTINLLSREESLEVQKAALQGLIQAQYIETVKLNPYQINHHYTIPHALLYDLQQHKMQLDCLLMYSRETIQDFAHTYPARWLILKSYFNRILTVV